MTTKITAILLTLFLSFGMIGCGGGRDAVDTNAVPPPAIQSPTPVPTVWNPKDGNYNGHGTVTKVKLDIGTVEIDHEKIEGMMDAMKMEFNVSDKKMLDGLKVGDHIDFVIEYKDRNETVIGIKKTQ